MDWLLVLKILLGIVEFPLVYYLIIPFVLAASLWTMKHFKEEEFITGFSGKLYDFAVVATAHQQGLFIEPLVDSLKKQTYKNFVLYVICDDVKEDFSHLESDFVKIIYPNPPLHAKTKSIGLAIDSFIRKHDNIIVLDADNLMHPRYLEVMNYYFNKGYKCVQGRIKAKNLNTSAARMDAANEIYYSFIDKYSRGKVGLSSAMWGLGFAIDLEVFKKINFDHYFSGFDKKLQSEVILLVDKVAYANFAIIYDEKTSDKADLVTQRAKWLFGYFKYCKLGMKALNRGIFYLDFDRFNYGLNHMRPPLVLLFPASLFFLTINFFLSPVLFWSLLVSMIIFLIAFLMIQVRYGYDDSVWKTLPQLPIFMVLQLFALFRTKKAKRHTHTKHTQAVNLDEVINMYNE
jgi:cellulose synthase/poly-beta-1,6-N-acetylglucosamine synthase-like glycosyltransferase